MIVTCAVADDAALPFGLYVTVIVHVPPLGSVKPDTQVPPVTVKPLPVGPGPVTMTAGAAVNVSGPGVKEVALLVTVTVPLWEVVVPVTSEGTGAEKIAVATVVVPVTATMRGRAPVAVTVKTAAFAPARVEEPFRPGVKLTLMVQLAPTARVFGLIGQLFAWLNTDELFRAMNAIPVIDTGKGPGFERVTGRDGLAVRSG